MGSPTHRNEEQIPRVPGPVNNPSLLMQPLKKVPEKLAGSGYGYQMQQSNDSGISVSQLGKINSNGSEILNDVQLLRDKQMAN